MSLLCPLGGMVDTTDLKSVDRKVVPVRVWQRAPLRAIQCKYINSPISVIDDVFVFLE